LGLGFCFYLSFCAFPSVNGATIKELHPGGFSVEPDLVIQEVDQARRWALQEGLSLCRFFAIFSYFFLALLICRNCHTVSGFCGQSFRPFLGSRLLTISFLQLSKVDWTSSFHFAEQMSWATLVFYVGSSALSLTCPSPWDRNRWWLRDAVWGCLPCSFPQISLPDSYSLLTSQDFLDQRLFAFQLI